MADLVTITTDGGARLRVARDQAQRILDMANNVELRMPINPKPEETAGYNNRNIAGTRTPSQHAFGRAVDINASQNARGTQGDIRRYYTPDELAKQASDGGMRWGGTWSNPDDMHFEVARGAAPAPLGSPSMRAPASAGLNEASDAGLQPLSLLPAYRAPFTAPPPSDAVATRRPPGPEPTLAALPAPPAPQAAPPAAPFSPAGAKPQGEDGLSKAHAEAVQQAQRGAMEWAQQRRKPLTGLSSLNDQLFGAA